jgi:hypothetical protein
VSLAYALDRGIQVFFQVEQQEIAVELIGEGEQERLLFWEAAEGGNGIWQRLIEDPHAMARVAEEALRVCHFDPQTGDEIGNWANECSRACYDCLLSYSNQFHHALIDRHEVKEFLMSLSRGTTARNTGERTRQEQYDWLESHRDPASTLERDFLKSLLESGRRLPDRAQYRPEKEVFAEADFYYDRNALPGVCVFCDGPDHDAPARRESDTRERNKLRELGYRVAAIRYDRALVDQLLDLVDILGKGGA